MKDPMNQYRYAWHWSRKQRICPYRFTIPGGAP